MSTTTTTTTTTTTQSSNNWSPSLSIVGQSLPRIDAIEKATGRAKFTRDVSVPGMLYAGALRSPYASAKITSIDTSKAKALPGVKAVITYNDFWMKNPSPYLGSSTYWALDDTVRFAGYEVAAVAAVDRETVLEALDLISVQYQQLPVIKTIDDALASGASEVHVGTGNIAYTGKKPYVYSIGDVNAGLSQADVVVDKVFTTSNSAHKAQAEPASFLAIWQGADHLEIWEKNKRLHLDREELATDLGLIPANVIFTGSYVGGDFGNRSYSRGTFIASVLARQTGLPVKYEDDAEEHSFDEGPRMRGRFETKVGAKKDGTITALYGKFLWDVGAFCSQGPATGTFSNFLFTYNITNGYGEHWPVLTNNPPTSGFRGYGTLGPTAALETTLNELAETLGIDPITLRRKNVNAPPITTYNPNAEIDRVIQDSGWSTKWVGWKKPYSVNGSKVRAVGFSANAHQGGGTSGNFETMVRYTVDGKLVLYAGSVDQGQGNHTGMAMIAAEAAGVNYPDDIIFQMPQVTNATPRAPSASGNTLTVGYGWSVMQAALNGKSNLLAIAGPIFKLPANQLDVKGGYVFEIANTSNKKLIRTVLGAASPTALGSMEVYGSASVNKPRIGLVDQGFHAAVADVEVDTDTGTVTVLNLFTTHDVGQALNPSVLDSGFRGAISGFALEFALHPLDAVDPSSLRRLTFPTGSYGTDSLTIGDFPNHQTTFLTTPNPYGPYGALGCEEGPHKLITPAIIDAIYNAIGVRFYQAPITYDVILKALGKV